MTAVEYSQSEEKAIEQLVGVAISQPNAALDIMLINSNCLPLLSLVPNRSGLAIIEVEGQNEDSLKALARAKSKLATVLLPKFGRIVGQMQVTALSQQLPREESAIEGLLKQRVSPDTFQQITRYQMSQISLVDREIIEAIVGLFIDSGIAKTKSYPETFNMGQITRELFRLKLIRSEFLASICHKCGNFQFLISPYAVEDNKCKFCNEHHLFVRIYVFDESFNRLKLENLDLPLFIKKYIEKVSFGILHVEISRKIDNGRKGEIDVFLEKTKLGIECKVFVHPSIPGNKLDSTAGDIANQLSKYSDVGVLRAIVVTNLAEEDCKQLKSKIDEILLSKNVQFEKVKIVHRSFEFLLKTLNEEIELAQA